MSTLWRFLYSLGNIIKTLIVYFNAVFYYEQMNKKLLVNNFY